MDPAGVHRFFANRGWFNLPAKQTLAKPSHPTEQVEDFGAECIRGLLRRRRFRREKNR